MLIPKEILKIRNFLTPQEMLEGALLGSLYFPEGMVEQMMMEVWRVERRHGRGVGPAARGREKVQHCS